MGFFFVSQAFAFHGGIVATLGSKTYQWATFPAFFKKSFTLFEAMPVYGRPYPIIKKPSRADEYLTQKIKEAAQYFDIAVMDHIIVSEEGYYSFADEGIL